MNVSSPSSPSKKESYRLKSLERSETTDLEMITSRARQIQSTINTNAKPKNSFLSNLLDHTKNKKQDSDSKLSLAQNFVRGFRREHTDFFPLSKRHSAILGERQAPINNTAFYRASAIYSKSNNKNKTGEPTLTDFVSHSFTDSSAQCGIQASKSSTNTSTTITTSTTTTTTTTTNKTINTTVTNNKTNNSNVNSPNSFYLGPRREKTESVISLRNSTNRNLLFDQLQVKT